MNGDARWRRGAGATIGVLEGPERPAVLPGVGSIIAHCFSVQELRFTLFVLLRNVQPYVILLTIRVGTLRCRRGNARPNAFADGSLVMQSAVQPFRHLPLPVQDVGKLVPATGAVLAAWDTDDIAPHADLLKSSLKIGGLGKRNVFILIAENLQKWRIIFRNVGDGRGFANGLFLALLRNQRIEKTMNIRVERNKFKAALSIETDHGLRPCALAVNRV